MYKAQNFVGFKYKTITRTGKEPLKIKYLFI